MNFEFPLADSKRSAVEQLWKTQTTRNGEGGDFLFNNLVYSPECWQFISNIYVTKCSLTNPAPNIFFKKSGQLGPKVKLSRAQLAKNRNGRVHSSY